MAWHLVRLTFLLWKTWYQGLVMRVLDQENERLRAQLGRKKDSIYQMNKAALVGLAMRLLGWSRVDAEQETVGQFRLYLKEKINQDKLEAESQEWALPKALGRMKLVELGIEADRRGLDTVSETGRGLSREELIRVIKAHAQEHAFTSETATANPTTSGMPATSTNSSFLMTPRSKAMAGSGRPSSEPPASSRGAPRPLQARRGVRRANSPTFDVGGDFTMLEEDSEL